MNKFKKGDKVKCTAARDENNLTVGKIYTVLKDEEDGIFADRPYVTVDGDLRQLCCHSSRFELETSKRED